MNFCAKQSLSINHHYRTVWLALFTDHQTPIATVPGERCVHLFVVLFITSTISPSTFHLSTLFTSPHSHITIAHLFIVTVLISSCTVPLQRLGQRSSTCDLAVTHHPICHPLSLSPPSVTSLCHHSQPRSNEGARRWLRLSDIVSDHRLAPLPVFSRPFGWSNHLRSNSTQNSLVPHYSSFPHSRTSLWALIFQISCLWILVIRTHRFSRPPAKRAVGELLIRPYILCST